MAGVAIDEDIGSANGEMSLERRLKALISETGPIPVSTWMTLCLHDPHEGYYATDPGLGRDFITAPETSQAFGELIGLWCVEEWRAMGAPDPFILCELGPGRGTLMADALRAASVAPDFLSAMQLVLIEASPTLQSKQTDALVGHRPVFVESLEDVPAGPALILGNEFLDCLPARQFVQTESGWQERVIGIDETGGFVFGLAAADIPAEAHAAPGQEVDLQPGLDTLVAALAARQSPMCALFIDYGETDAAPGDTVRAYRDNAQVDPLSRPGWCDITVDVDFGRLARLAGEAGLDVAGPVMQGPFLGALGIQARMHQLIQANRDQASAIHRAIAQLVEPDKMGARFKVIGLSSPGLPPMTGLG